MVLDDVVLSDVPAGTRTKIKCLTAEDIASGKYSIWDVLLPLPGYVFLDIEYHHHVFNELHGINALLP